MNKFYYQKLWPVYHKIPSYKISNIEGNTIGHGPIEEFDDTGHGWIMEPLKKTQNISKLSCLE